MPITNCHNCHQQVYKRPYNISKGSVYCSKKCQFDYKNKNRKPEGNCICLECGKNYRTNPAYIRRSPGKNRYCSRECMWNFRKRDRISSSISSGYVVIKGSRNTRRLHRFLMEQKIGRKLNRNEHVHHINGNKLDNRIENLMLLSASDHHKLHGRKRTGIWCNCKYCGKKIYRPRSYILLYGEDRTINHTRCKKCYYKKVMTLSRKSDDLNVIAHVS